MLHNVSIFIYKNIINLGIGLKDYDGVEGFILTYSPKLQKSVKDNALTFNLAQLYYAKQEYDKVIAICRQLYINKMKDYGSAWRILRLPSLTDQIFIKAQRIRSLQQNDIRKVDEDESGEFIGIINR